MERLAKVLENTIAGIFTIFLFVTWMLGIVIAKGLISTIFAFFPFYAWYLVIEFFFNRWLT